MSRFFMGVQLFIVILFFIGAEVKANPMEHCMEMVKFDEVFNSTVDIAGEEQLNLYCVNLTVYMDCINNVIKEQTGFSLRELADLLKGTEVGEAFTFLVNIADLIGEICTEGTTLRSDYLEHIECFHGLDKDLRKLCDNQAKGVYETFRELHPERTGRRQKLDESCITAGFQLGCVGAAIHEECGDGAFGTYKDFVKKIGFFKSSICPSELMTIAKTTLMDTVDMSESRKSLYRLILDLKKRRK